MNHIPKRTYFALAVILTLNAVSGAQSVQTKKGKVDVTTLSQEAQIEHFREMRASVADDPFRPIYHFSPPAYGLHDVAGLCWWRGKYHLFYLINVIVFWLSIYIMRTRENSIGSSIELNFDGNYQKRLFKNQYFLVYVYSFIVNFRSFCGPIFHSTGPFD